MKVPRVILLLLAIILFESMSPTKLLEVKSSLNSSFDLIWKTKLLRTKMLTTLAQFRRGVRVRPSGPDMCPQRIPPSRLNKL